MTNAPACTGPSSISASASGERGEDRLQQEQALLKVFRQADKRKRELILRFARQLTA